MTLGLKGIVVRDLVREESATSEILGTVLLFRLIGAAIATLISYSVSSYLCCIIHSPNAKTGGGNANESPIRAVSLATKFILSLSA
ncbi:MAG: hypothetical protein AAFQ80_14915 [Cyanobacteria bacterium J06621_8]